VDIALFDLELIPYDSAAAFTRHLIDEGVLEPDFEAEYEPRSDAASARTRAGVACARAGHPPVTPFGAFACA
jgi:hypothetical protein